MKRILTLVAACAATTGLSAATDSITSYFDTSGKPTTCGISWLDSLKGEPTWKQSQEITGVIGELVNVSVGNVPMPSFVPLEQNCCCVWDETSKEYTAYSDGAATEKLDIETIILDSLRECENISLGEQAARKLVMDTLLSSQISVDLAESLLRKVYESGECLVRSGSPDRVAGDLGMSERLDCCRYVLGMLVSCARYLKYQEWSMKSEKLSSKRAGESKSKKPVGRVLASFRKWAME